MVLQLSLWEKKFKTHSLQPLFLLSFFAATIYSRGTTRADFKRAYDYANKAYSLVQFKDDDFASQVKGLYNNLSEKLKNNDQSIQTQDAHNSPFKIQPALSSRKKWSEI